MFIIPRTTHTQERTTTYTAAQHHLHSSTPNVLEDLEGGHEADEASDRVRSRVLVQQGREFVEGGGVDREGVLHMAGDHKVGEGADK